MNGYVGLSIRQQSRPINKPGPTVGSISRNASASTTARSDRFKLAKLCHVERIGRRSGRQPVVVVVAVISPEQRIQFHSVWSWGRSDVGVDVAHSLVVTDGGQHVLFVAHVLGTGLGL